MPKYRLGRLKDNFVVTWRAEDGKRTRHRLFAASEGKTLRTEDEAKRRFREFVRRSEIKAVPEIAELWEAYRKDKAGRRIVTTMGYEWRAMGPHFGTLRAEEISNEVCRHYIKTRRNAGKQDGTIWTELGHLRTVLKWAEMHRMIDYAPPIERPQKPAPKDRWLTAPECYRLIESAPTLHIKLAIILLLSTAGRIGAVLELTWDRVDFERSQIDLKVDKLGPRKGRATNPMNAGARAALQEAKKGSLSEYVVEWNGQPVKSIKTGFNRAAKAAKLEKVTPHTLRHTAAVHLAAAGVPMVKISQYLGHSNTAITEHTYARFAPDHLTEEAAILDFTRVQQVQ